MVGEEGEFQDGPGDEVREHGGEAGEVGEVLHGCGIASIDVDDVAECLEGVETDTEWEGEMDGGDPGLRDAERFTELREGCEAEVAVFEEGESGKVAEDGKGQRAFLAGRPWCFLGKGDGWRGDGPRVPSVLSDDEAEEPIEGGGCEHQEDERGFSPAVECVTCES